MKKFFTKEVQIALVAIVAIVVLFFGMQFLKGLTLFSNNNSYYAHFSDITGLSASSPVYANGFKVGVVESIDYNYADPNNIIAVIGLDKKMRLPKGTTAEIASDLLGNVKLELKMGPNPIDFMEHSDTIKGKMQQGALAKAGEMIPQIEQMLPKLDSILASVNALLADPALRNSMHNVDDITANLTVTTRELNRLTASLNQQMPGMLNKADGLLANTQQVTHQLSQLNIGETMSKVNMTLTNVEQMTAKLNSNEGTLGLLMRDPGLYNSLNATMSDADSLMIDFRKHPKRYIHFSVFGKKDN